ncbi:MULTISPECIES: GNAT family N-acetyltransferase [unclassified Listeria]|uniref:GNAT family N-acetyltransferase n=1 Tax=unclassified Listeria TaxID=2642072 RepID=UPI0021012F6B|nr:MULTISPECIES: GNAT family N-acetyltransferase [unclassified Listeria]
MIQVITATECRKDPRMEMSRIFVDGFYQWLKFFSKDKKKLAKAFSHAFQLDVFHLAIIDQEIAGMTALNDGSKPTLILDKKELRKHLGFIRGSIAFRVLKYEFEEKQYPFPSEVGLGYIEFVATSENYRHMGVASTLIQSLLETARFTSYALEVADTNSHAVRLYQKLGFKEFMRVEMKHKKHSGVNYLLYMKRTEETA